jgi:hypothetical protein
MTNDIYTVTRTSWIISYMFPCNIQIMIDLSPEDLDLGARDLRTRMFCMIRANAIVGIDFRPLVKNQSEVVKLYSVCNVKYPVRHPVARTGDVGRHDDGWTVGLL